METFVANLDDTGTACYMVVALNLRYKLCLYLYHYDGQSLPIDTLADGSDIVCLCRIVELKIDRIVHMPELVNVVETVESQVPVILRRVPLSRRHHARAQFPRIPRSGVQRQLNW